MTTATRQATEAKLDEMSWDELVSLKATLRLENRLSSSEFYTQLKLRREIDCVLNRLRAMDAR